MATNISVYTGSGAEVGSIPNEGAADYYPSLQNMAELLAKACRDSYIFSRSIAIGDPASSNSGLKLAYGADFDIDIPFDHEADTGGPCCLPLLMARRELASGAIFPWQACHIITAPLPSGQAWYPNNTIGPRLLPVGIAVSVYPERIRESGRTSLLTISHPPLLGSLDSSSDFIRYRGLVWFPKRREDIALFNIR